jgi:hypothetical protein
MLLVIVGGLFSFLSMQTAAAYGETGFSRTIGSDTVWTKTGSPYTLDGNVLVEEDATLTIEPGVTVNLGHNIIQVNGTLKVQGSVSDKIVFTTENKVIYDRFTPLGGFSFGDQSSNCIIENTILETTVFTYYNCKNSITLNNNYFKDQQTPTTSGSLGVTPTIRGSGNATITNNIFTGRIQLGCSAYVVNNTFTKGGIDGFNGGFYIVNNTIDGVESSGTNGYGISLEMVKPTVISDNHISQYSEACIRLYDGPAVIQRNHLESRPDMDGYPFFGLEIDGCSPLIQNNTITNTGVAVCLRDSGAKLAKPTFQYNNIYDNLNSNIFLGYPARPGYKPVDYTALSYINAANNWWGTTDNQEISQTMHDSKNQADLGKIQFNPYLTTPNTQATPNPNAPIPAIKQVSAVQFLVATMENGQKVELTMFGNLRISQHVQINVTTNFAALQTNITFMVGGEKQENSFFNLTIPKSVVAYGDSPTVYASGIGNSKMSIKNQGCSQDNENYYVWCTTSFNDGVYDPLTIEFSNPPQTLITNPLFIIGITATIIAIAGLTIFAFTKKKNPKTNMPSQGL